MQQLRTHIPIMLLHLLCVTGCAINEAHLFDPVARYERAVFFPRNERALKFFDDSLFVLHQPERKDALRIVSAFRPVKGVRFEAAQSHDGLYFVIWLFQGPDQQVRCLTNITCYPVTGLDSPLVLKCVQDSGGVFKIARSLRAPREEIPLYHLEAMDAITSPFAYYITIWSEETVRAYAFHHMLIGVDSKPFVDVGRNEVGAFLKKVNALVQQIHDIAR